MQLGSGEKKAIAITAAVVVVFVVVVATTVGVLVSGTEHHRDDHPYAQLAIDDRLVRVEPAKMCDVMLRHCTPEKSADVHIPKVPIAIGDTVLVSVPQTVGKWPWNLVAQYVTPTGQDVQHIENGSDQTFSTTLRSTRDHVLVNIEIQLPSAVGDPDNLRIRGYIAADTTPKGFRLPD